MARKRAKPEQEQPSEATPEDIAEDAATLRAWAEHLRSTLERILLELEALAKRVLRDFGLPETLARVYRADFASTCARYGIVPISV